MRPISNIRTACVASLSALLLCAAHTPAFAQDIFQQAQPTLEIENFIGRMTITNGESVSIKGADGGTISDNENVWNIDGGEDIKVSSCRESNSRVEISFGSWSWLGRSGGYKNLDEYPHLKITLPSNTHLKISGSVIYGDGKDLGSADISLGHCSDLVFGDITGPLDLDISASGDLTADHVGAADIRIKGSGDVTLESVSDLEVSINGSGDFEVGAITGDAILSSRGSGDIDIDELTGVLDYQSNGSGDLSIDDIESDQVKISTNGSGDVDFGSGNIDRLKVRTNGSGDVSFRGQAGDVEARSNGSSDIYVRKASGEVRANVSGSGGVKIDGVRYKRD